MRRRLFRPIAFKERFKRLLHHCAGSIGKLRARIGRRDRIVQVQTRPQAANKVDQRNEVRSFGTGFTLCGSSRVVGLATPRPLLHSYSQRINTTPLIFRPMV